MLFKTLIAHPFTVTVGAFVLKSQPTIVVRYKWQ